MILKKALVLLPVLYFTEMKAASEREGGGRRGRSGKGGKGEEVITKITRQNMFVYFSLFQQSVVVYRVFSA